jgi:uncharacterized protein
MATRFTWDAAKAERNQRVHGISFETAKEVFDDPNHVASENYFIASDGEQRSEPDAEVIHLTSARKAVDYEESIYEDQFR